MNRDKPMKIDKSKVRRSYDEDYLYEYYPCPNCGYTISVYGGWAVNYDEVNYCKHCGQRLDWSGK